MGLSAHVSVLLASLAVAAIEIGCSPAQTPQGASDKALAQLDFRQVVQSAKGKVFPAVVYIKAILETHESGRKSSQEVGGSGVMISSKGELLTNWHVVDKATEIRCLLYDGRAYSAKTVGSDKDTDLALLQLALPAGKTVPCAQMDDSARLKEGDFVMAMGAPWGLSRSVSIGIISCTTRYLPHVSEYSLWLQTDASISPGNSGGPLVNTNGKVIGLNTRGSSRGGDMGFAIPSETIAHIVAQLREYGKVNWSWMGLQLQPLKNFDKNIYFEGDQGVIIGGTDPDSPARLAGIQQRDRILKVNGQLVQAVWAEDLPALRRKLGLLSKSKPVELTIQRGDKILPIRLQPREKGKVEGEELDCPRWDMTVKAINQFNNPALYFHRKKGVFLFGIRSPGNAGNSGLREEDILLKIDGKEVVTLEDVKAIHKKAIDNVGEKFRIVFTVIRGGLSRQIVLDFSRDHQKE